MLPTAVTLPVTLTDPPVKLAVFTVVVKIPLLAVAFPVTLTNPPVKLAVFTMVVNIPLLALTLPVALRVVATTFAPATLPAVEILPPEILPVTLTNPPVKLAAFDMLANTLSAITLLVTDTPVVVNTATLDVPPMLTDTLAFGDTVTLLLPLTIWLPAAMVILEINPPSPKKYPDVLILPAAETFAPVVKLPATTFPVDETIPVTTATFVALSKVNPALAPAFPESLNSTCVLDPGTVRFPEILPANVPIKYPLVLILPVADTCPSVIRLPPLILPCADISPPVLTLAAVTLPPADTNPAVLTLAAVALPDTDNDPPVKLATLTTLVNMPLLAVVLPVTLIDPPVKLATLTTLVNIPLLAVALPVTLTNPPVKLAVFTIVVNIPLLAVALPVTLINPPVKLVVFTVPATFSPLVENTAMFGVPPTATVILPLDTAMLTFDVPLEILLEIATTPVRLAPLPNM